MSSIRGDIQLNQGHNAVAQLGDKVVRHAESGCALVADASIYYREDLAEAVGLKNSAADDTELLLSAYLRWGEDCVRHLHGDFAFAISDPRENKLFCARDRYGLRPFHYHYNPCEYFAFASSARDVLRCERVPYAINEQRIADFIVPQLEWADYTSTFYEGVFRLPPAHTLTVSDSGVAIEEYWTPRPGPELACKSDDEFREAFLEVFSRAVEERLNVTGDQVGTMLSGGMDSGSVTAVANELLSKRQRPSLSVYSLARRRGADCHESERIYATLDHLKIGGTQIFADEVESLPDGLGSDLAEPFDGDFLFLDAIYKTARNEGVKVVLDGGAGDLVFNAGGYINRLLRRGHFRQAWHETLGDEEYWGGRQPRRAMMRYLASSFAPRPVKEWLRGPRQRRNENQYVNSSLIREEFANHIDIAGRFEQMRELFTGVLSDDPDLERVLKIRPNLTAGRERFGRIAALAGVKARDPFTDQNVVDFCSRLPDKQLTQNGWPKFLLRTAMQDLLPDAVRWGRGKPHIGHLYNKMFLEREVRNTDPDTLARRLEPYVDDLALNTAWQSLAAGGDASPIHAALILSRWLDESVIRPVVNNQGFG